MGKSYVAILYRLLFMIPWSPLVVIYVSSEENLRDCYANYQESEEFLRNEEDVAEGEDS
jgi:hypothetical protein